jgi:RNA polymerase sigma-70 factor (ECF subfamily)
MKIDEMVFDAAQAGDPAALDKLLRLLQPDIRRYARHQCHASTVIEDVVQEAQLLIFRKMHNVRSVHAFGGWIFKVVARLCMLPALSLLRHTQDIATVEEARYFATASQDELRLDLIKAIEALPFLYRQALLLRDTEQLTISEMASLLQVTPAAVKSRIHRGRYLVREYLSSSVALHGSDSH